MDGLATKMYKALLRAIWHLKITDIWWKACNEIPLEELVKGQG